jgi:tetratricopeptide (TPR) repeat protein
LLVKGIIEGFKGNMEQQREYFQKLVSLYPEDERAHDLLGNSYFSQQDYNQAIGEYRRATQINPDYSPAYNQLGYCHKYLKNYEEAKEAFRQYIKLIPEDPNPYDSYAELLMKMGKFESSIEIYRKALNIDPTFINSYIGIATNLNFLQKYEDARNELKGAMEQNALDEQKRALWYAKAVSYLYEGKYDTALEVLSSSFQIMASLKDTLHMSEILNNMGRIYLEQRETNEALSKYSDSNQLINASSFPGEMIKLRDRFYTLILAYIDLIEGDFAKARQKAGLLDDKSELSQNRFQSWNYHQLLGSIAYREKNYDYAIGEFQRSNLQNPYNLYRIALAYLGKNDKGKAREFAEMAANDNTFNSMEYAFVRQKATDLYENLSHSN